MQRWAAGSSEPTTHEIGRWAARAQSLQRLVDHARTGHFAHAYEAALSKPGEDIIRASVGLENAEDLIRDLDQALRARSFKGLIGPLAYQIMKKI